MNENPDIAQLEPAPPSRVVTIRGDDPPEKVRTTYNVPWVPRCTHPSPARKRARKAARIARRITRRNRK